MGKEKETNSLLDTFEFDNSEDFFGIKEVETLEDTEVKEVTKNIVKEEEKKEDKKTEKQKEAKKENKKEEKKEEKENIDNDKNKKDEKRTEDSNEEEHEFFTDTETENTEDAPDQVKETSKFKTTIDVLSNLGFIENKEIDTDKITEEDIENIIETEINKRLDSHIEEIGSNLSEEDKLFLKFKKEGGKSSDFFKVLQTDSVLEDLNVEDIENDEKKQEDFLVQYYEDFEELSTEEAEDKVEWLKERDKLKNTAVSTFTKLTEHQKKEKQKLLEKQKEDNRIREENNKKYREDLKNTLNETEEVGKIKITKKDKNTLFDYMIKPTIKLQNGKLITEFQKDLSEIYGDKKMLIGFAKAVRERFNIEDLNEKTKIVKEIKRNIRSNENGHKSLTDYF